MMTRSQLFDEFHNHVATTSNEQMQTLNELTHDGSFAREAGVEFVLAVATVADERGMK